MYDLTEFDDQLTVFRQYCVYIINIPSTNIFLDFSNNREIQNNVKREDFFTYTTAKRLYINLRDSLGITGKKDPLKHSDESIKVKISLQDATPFDLDIIMKRQSSLEFVYEQGSDGNMVSLFEYEIVKENKDKNLEEYSNNFRLNRKRKLIGFDQEISRQVWRWLGRKQHRREIKVAEKRTC